MNLQKLKPNFCWDEFFWTAEISLPSWMNICSENRVSLIFAPDGRGDEPLSKEENLLINWVIENEEKIFDSCMNSLFHQYPEIYATYAKCYDENEVNEFLPKINNIEELMQVVEVSSINIHPLEKKGIPFIGVELNCPWDDEHGLGILLWGDKVLKIGQGDTAILLWFAKEYMFEC